MTKRIDFASATDAERAEALAGAEPMEAPGRYVLTDARWRWLADRGAWLSETPPTRRYLLAAPGDGGHGMLPLGRVAMLAAGGGMGKSWALTQLALCVATGRPWFGTYPVATPGHVLLALAEEEEGEIQRRLFHAARALALTDKERAEAARRILPLALCGENVALTQLLDDGAETETTFAAELRERLEGAGVEWRLLLLDPVSRFAGPDVETDNAAATRFVQTLERLTRVPGGPTLMVAHHTNKGSRTSEVTSAGAARGASALTDGVRWQANLETVLRDREENAEADATRRACPNLTRFAVVKSNLAAVPEPLYLRRDPDNNGALHPITDAEAERERSARVRPGEWVEPAAPRGNK